MVSWMVPVVTSGSSSLLHGCCDDVSLIMELNACCNHHSQICLYAPGTQHSWKLHIKCLSGWNKTLSQNMCKSPQSRYSPCFTIVAQGGHRSTFYLHETLNFRFGKWKIVIYMAFTYWWGSKVVWWLDGWDCCPQTAEQLVHCLSTMNPSLVHTVHQPCAGMLMPS